MTVIVESLSDIIIRCVFGSPVVVRLSQNSEVVSSNIFSLMDLDITGISRKTASLAE